MEKTVGFVVLCCFNLQGHEKVPLCENTTRSLSHFCFGFLFSSRSFRWRGRRCWPPIEVWLRKVWPADLDSTMANSSWRRNTANCPTWQRHAGKNEVRSVSGREWGWRGSCSGFMYVKYDHELSLWRHNECVLVVELMTRSLVHIPGVDELTCPCAGRAGVFSFF